MELKNKKLVAREILIFSSLVATLVVVSIALLLQNYRIDKIKVENETKRNELQRMIDDYENKIDHIEDIYSNKIKPWERNYKTKIIPTPEEILSPKKSNIGNSQQLINADLKKIDKLRDTIEIVSNELKKLSSERLLIGYDLYGTIKTWLIILFILFYPLRLFYYGVDWALHTLKNN